MFDSQVPINWPFIPSVLIGLLLLTVAYFGAVTVWRGRFPGSRPIGAARPLAFLWAMFSIYLALHTPVDLLSDGYLFSVHMLQHLLLTLVMPPLLLASIPAWLIRPPFARWPFLLPLGRFLTGPLPAFAIFNALFIGYHVPALYGLVQRSEPLHIASHLLFMAAGVLTWWPVISPLPELPALAPPLRLLYLFLQTLPSQALGALLTFSGAVLYANYAGAPRVWEWLTPERDQQLGGLLMWVGGGTFFLGAFVVVFLRWAQTAEAGERQRRRAMGRA